MERVLQGKTDTGHEEEQIMEAGTDRGTGWEDTHLEPDTGRNVYQCPAQNRAEMRQ